VDLANMMLVLAVRTDAERVYRRALNYFTPDEIAEAFAAARGVASPTQLRTAMKKDGRDLVAQFRALAPERRPISLQRWGFMRIGLAAALLFGGFLALQATAGIFTSDLQVAGTPNCGTDNLMILMAQAVPSAESVPCISSLPAGWKLGGVEIRRGQGRFWLDSDKGGKHAVEARLLPPEKCDLSGASEVPSDEVGTRRYEKPDKLPPDLRSTRSYVFEGGCVTYQFEFHGNASASLMFDADGALAFQPRDALVVEVQNRADLRLCGAAAPPCPGS
jgi:hypothetical protein